jgi:hypothetical protein
MDRLRSLHVVPVGYIDRPGSANILRTLELASLSIEAIDRDALRSGDYRFLTDRLLWADLAPNERTGLFTVTSERNERLRQAGTGQRGHQVVCFYLNVARPAAGERHPAAIVARVELPGWDGLVDDPAMLDLVQSALYANSRSTGYPYVLARAHELAVVGSVERASLDALLEQALLRRGVLPTTSAKATLKRWTGSRRRR